MLVLVLFFLLSGRQRLFDFFKNEYSIQFNSKTPLDLKRQRRQIERKSVHLKYVTVTCYRYNYLFSYSMSLRLFAIEFEIYILNISIML